jgi:uncharacterized membrane protein YkoI
MRTRTKYLASAAAIAAIAIGAGAVAAGATGGEEQDTPIPSADIDAASKAALAHTGQGRVTETEVGDEESYYEVEVTLDDGSQVDVQLDASFNVVGSKTDREDDGE